MTPTPLQAIADVPNACQLFPNLLTGGQPQASTLEALRAAGGGVILDLREPMEPRPIDEPALTRQLGMEYVNVPVGGGTLSDKTLERILAVLRDADARQRTVFCHCGVGARVGGAVIPYLILDRGYDEDTAVAEGMRVGLRSAELLEWGLDYARRHAGKPQP
jgi:protein tyrosine phosphatase (PTP) superfamily phosphohydrolase (DUF442 family)